MNLAVRRSAIEHNLIIASLPDDERFRVVRLMEPVDLPAGAELVRSCTRETAVWFPTSGLVSIVSSMSDGAAVESAAVGAEGWAGAEMFGGSMPAGSAAVQQIAGSALRMSSASFEAALADVPAFAASVTRFMGVLLSFTMQTAACNRLHDATARCAHWLLFTCDRVGHGDLAITHESLGRMLGASRSGVTATLAKLERQRLIERSRAHVVIRDAAGLRRVACECHGVLLEVYSRYIAGLG